MFNTNNEQLVHELSLDLSEDVEMSKQRFT